MELDTVKTIATIAAPLTKLVFETFLKPKFEDIKNKWKREDNILDYAFEDKFLDYLNESYEKNAVLNTVAFKKRKILLNEVYVPLTLQCQNQQNKKESLVITEFNNELFNNSNKILITDTAGMGKSTLSKRMLISCIETNQGVPILIELRRLSKNKDIVQEILEQLNPINDTIDKQFILDLIKRGDFIFFFDGFDEISLTDRSLVTTEIQKFISKARKNKFVLTSRPEESLSSFGDFYKYQIKPLIPDEAFELIEKYDPSKKIAPLLISKIEEPENFESIKEYLTTPLLVSLLFTAFEHKQSIPFKKHIFYRQVFDALFDSHDLSKGDSFEREKYSKLGSDEFHRVLRAFGYFCLKKENKIEFSRDELGQIIKESLEYADVSEVKSSDFIKDILITVPIFSKDGIYYKWSHKSLQEYFAAQFIYVDSKEQQNDILKHISFHEDNTAFLNIIDLYRSMDPLGFENVITKKMLTDYLNYLTNSYQNFNGQEKLERQELTFGHEIFLINIAFHPETKENHPGQVFKILKDYINSKRPRMSLGINVAENEADISFIKIPEINKPVQSLIQYHNTLKKDFIKQIKTNTKDDKIELKLVKRKPYKVTDRKNSILNSETNFLKTNKLIKLYICRRMMLVIDKNNAERALAKINSRLTNTKSNNLLNY